MNTCELLGTKAGKIGWIVFALFASRIPANSQKVDFTPLFGANFGGTLKVRPEVPSSNRLAHLQDSAVYGLAAGFRFDGDDCESCNVIEFRWMRQSTNLVGNGPTPPSVTPLQTPVTLNFFLSDFTYEWTLPEAKPVRPFVIASLGAVRMSTVAAGGTRFAFGIGGGVKIFPQPWWGLRFQMEYLPTVMAAEVQTVVCRVGCVVALGGGVMNQWEVVAGPVFRF